MKNRNQLNQLLKNRYIRFFPVLAIMASIFFLSHTPGDNLPTAFSGMDKICHASMYGALALSCLFALQPWIRVKPFPVFGAGVILFCLLYGVSDEFHQSFIPGRSSEWQDLVADASGSILVVFGWWFWSWRNRQSLFIH